MATQGAPVGDNSLIDLGEDHVAATAGDIDNEQLQREQEPSQPIVNLQATQDPGTNAVPEAANITHEPIKVETSSMQPVPVPDTASVIDTVPDKAVESQDDVVDPLTATAAEVSHQQTHEHLQEPTQQQEHHLAEQTSIPHPLLDVAPVPTEQTASQKQQASDIDTAHLPETAMEMKTAMAATPTDPNFDTAVKTVRNYLDSTVVPVLRQAMRELCVKRPEDPYTFLADFILAHKPKNGQ